MWHEENLKIPVDSDPNFGMNDNSSFVSSQDLLNFEDKQVISDLSQTRASTPNVPSASSSHYIYSKSPVIGQIIDEKVLEPLDFIELAIYDKGFSDEEIIQLVKMFKDHLEMNSYLVKLFVFYSKIDVLIEAQPLFDTSDMFITEAITYAISIDRF